MIIENLPKNPVNRASKDILAKCMATEDLRVIHDRNAETAYFDTKNRVLCLPVWEDMSNSVYDMLVGHEVSHALHTPAEGWLEWVGEGKGSQIRHMFLNIVEDARIERLIKDKFPGLRRDFVDAYKQLHEKDMFELKNRKIDLEMPLIDRLNLHFKIGLFGHVTIPFAQDEKQYVTRMSNTETFEDVVALAKELYEKHLDELEDEDGSQPSPQSGDEDGDGESQGSQGQSSDDNGESQSEGSQSGSESSDGDEDGEGKGSGEDSGQSLEDDTDDGSSAKSEDGESQSEGSQQSGLEYDDYQEGVGAVAGSTQESFERSVNNLRKVDNNIVSYQTLPKMNLDNCVVSFSDIENIWTSWYAEKIEGTDYREAWQKRITDSDNELNKFFQRTKSTVAQMVQQFQMKQAADLDARTSFAKTGVLNTNNMINYRWSEDIFLKNEVHADGKNHGIVMYLDWSGSMSGILRDTVEQLLILTEFCKKVNIPFEVYAFSSRGHDNCENDRNANITNADEKDVLFPHRFTLLQFLSSDMKNNQYKTAVSKLYFLTTGTYNVPSELQLGCTPLNEAIMCAFQQVPDFQAKHGIQIVNTVFLTDGQGHSMGVNTWRTNKSYIHDSETRKDYLVNTDSHDAETETYLRILKEKTGTNLIGIRLIESRRRNSNLNRYSYHYFNNNADALKAGNESWKKYNYALVDSDGYHNLFLIRGNTEIKTDALENLADDASFTKLRNAFMKGTNNAKGTRVIANKMIDIISK